MIPMRYGTFGFSTGLGLRAKDRTVCLSFAPDGGEVSGDGRLDWDLPLAASGGEPGHGTAPGGSLSGKKETAVSGMRRPGMRSARNRTQPYSELKINYFYKLYFYLFN